MYDHYLYPCTFPKCKCADELDCPQAQTAQDKREVEIAQELGRMFDIMKGERNDG